MNEVTAPTGYRPVAPPAAYAAPLSLRTIATHPVLRARPSAIMLPAVLGPGVGIAGLCAMTAVMCRMIAFNMHMEIRPTWWIASTMVVVALGVLAAATSALSIDVSAGRAHHLSTAFDDAAAMLPDRHDRVTREMLEALDGDGRDDAAELRLRTALALAQVAHARREHEIVGMTPTQRAEADSIARSAIRSIATSADRERRAIAEDRERSDAIASRDAVERLAAAMPGAMAVARGRPALPAPRRQPTTDASINRIVANAESGLAIDPDLTDDGGARLDDLVRRHLPRLVARHAELSARARVEDLAAADADLARGLDLVSASVEEGLSTLRHASADALRGEVAFLRARRGEGA